MTVLRETYGPEVPFFPQNWWLVMSFRVSKNRAYGEILNPFVPTVVFRYSQKINIGEIIAINIIVYFEPKNAIIHFWNSKIKVLISVTQSRETFVTLRSKLIYLFENPHTTDASQTMRHFKNYLQVMFLQ